MQFYVVSLVQGCLPPDTERAWIRHILRKEHGIYYVMASKVPDYRLTISAMLLSTPNKEQELKISANAKYTETQGDDDGGDGGDKTITSYWPPVKKLIVPIRRGERLAIIDEYETALGLGNIQIHVGVCYE